MRRSPRQSSVRRHLWLPSGIYDVHPERRVLGGLRPGVALTVLGVTVG
jgi:hypothetical protein